MSTSAAFSADGQRVVTASHDNTARIWDAATGKELIHLTGHESGVTSAAFSADGQRVVTASDDNTARIWDAATGKELIRLTGHEGWVTSAAFSADGLRVVTASSDNTARIWDAATGICTMIRAQISDAAFVIDQDDHVLRMSESGWQYIYGIAIGPDGKRRVVLPAVPELFSDRTMVPPP